MLKEYWVMRNKENHEEYYNGADVEEGKVYTGYCPSLFSTKELIEHCFNKDISGFDGDIVNIHFGTGMSNPVQSFIPAKEMLEKFEAVKVKLIDMLVSRPPMIVDGRAPVTLSEEKVREIKEHLIYGKTGMTVMNLAMFCMDLITTIEAKDLEIARRKEPT